MPEAAITFYWLATIEADRGNTRITCSGTMPAVPGTHTRMSTTQAVLEFLQEQHGDVVVLFLSLEPNDITSAA